MAGPEPQHAACYSWTVGIKSNPRRVVSWPDSLIHSDNVECFNETELGLASHPECAPLTATAAGGGAIAAAAACCCW